MIATHEADVCGGRIKLCSIRPDPSNENMVFGLVVHDSRRKLHTGQRVWIARAQVENIEEPGYGYWEVGDY